MRLKTKRTKLFGEELVLRERALPNGALGHFDPKTGEVAIERTQPFEGKHIIAVHELLHVAEELLSQRGVLKRRVDHAFITNAAPILLALFIEFGFWRGLSRRRLVRFMSAGAPSRKPARRQAPASISEGPTIKRRRS
jgi:hypothetical protein